ncbi:MAG: PrgI family protein [Candidatus Saccharimonas sp.]
MAVYKVAQDVEADDKLLGPFSFRQFVYLIVVAIACALAYGLSRIFIPLAIIPLPVIIFFGALALPLRKDQPMEIYLAALLQYYLKPRRRFWTPDGVESLIEITAPKVVEVHRTKDITESEAERRLSYLADIADTEGWAVRHAAGYTGSAMVSDAYFEAQQTQDVLDTTGGVAQSIGSMIDQSTERRRQEAVALMQQASQQPVAPQPVFTPPPVADPYAQLGQPVQSVPQLPSPATTANPLYNPYPTNIHQSVIQPLSAGQQIAASNIPTATPVPQPSKTVSTPSETQVQNQSQNPTTKPSEKPLSPDIINLANNADLSIETIQREADRIQKKSEAEDGEVFISLH